MTRPIKESITGERNGIWAGDEVKYSALHAWVERHLGKPQFCEGCGTEEAKRYEWAAVDGEHKRNLESWLRLCVSCHRKYDGHAQKAATTRMVRHGGKPCLDCGKLTTSMYQLCKPHRDVTRAR